MTTTSSASRPVPTLRDSAARFVRAALLLRPYWGSYTNIVILGLRVAGVRSWVRFQLLELIQACVVVRAALARGLAPRVAADAVARKTEASSTREDATRQPGVAQRGG